MADHTASLRNPAGHAGLLNNLVALGNSLASFVESRASLLGQESKTALVQVLVLVACLVGAAVLSALGYAFLIASAVVGVAHALRTSWIWIALAAAGLHFILALICLLIARSRMKKPMLQASITELKKDREWLKHLDKTSR